MCLSLQLLALIVIKRLKHIFCRLLQLHTELGNKMSCFKKDIFPAAAKPETGDFNEETRLLTFFKKQQQPAL